jgi:modification methylase|tara:strand:+ start:4402 stop:5550 length:1149 start_codon:yes stop_codon:yes gene_type:complete
VTPLDEDAFNMSEAITNQKKDLPLNKIIKGNCIDSMISLPDNSIDVIFADPPYNLQLKNVLSRPDSSKVNGVTEDWDRFKSFEDYDQFTKGWMSEAQRILKPEGTIWVIGSYHNIFRVGNTMQNLGFWILNDIIWHKSNPMPNFKGTRFTNAHETIIWASKNFSSKYNFNYQAMKSLNEGTQMRSDWHIPICSGRERIRDSEGNKIHSTQKPEALLYRVLLSSSKKGDVILDPFFGTGTTGAVAKKLGRNFIGLEKESVYIKAAEKRIRAIDHPEEISLETTISKKAQKRVPFGSLVENGLIKPGSVLRGPRNLKSKKFMATVRADGSLLINGDSGSIHQMSAKVQGKESSNGWTFWHLEKEGKLELIDDLRTEFLNTNSTN